MTRKWKLLTLTRPKRLPHRNTLCSPPDPRVSGMSAGTDLSTISPQERGIHTPDRDFFPELLRRAQNPDGGWGYRRGLQSTAEATAWSILALYAHEGQSDEGISGACDCLRHTQTAEGAWPTSSGKEPGCWVTALACLALASA